MIKQILLQIIKDEFPMPLPGVVTSVDGMYCTVQPSNGDAEILKVRLIAKPDAEKYFVPVPKVNSEVMVSFITKHVAHISQVSEVEKILCKVGTVVFEVSADHFSLKKGTNIEFDINSTGFLLSKDNNTLKEILTLIVEATQQIMVIYGNNPDFAKLAQALAKINILLR